MWAVVLVMLGLLTGPETVVVTDAGTFDSERACQAEIARAVPSTLEGEIREAYERGERRYVCVRVREPARK